MTDQSILSKMARAIDPEAWATVDELFALHEVCGTDPGFAKHQDYRLQLSLSKAQAALDASGVREVLEPFGTFCPKAPTKAHRDVVVMGTIRPSDRIGALPTRLTQDDFRRARDFLNALSPSGEG